MKKKRTTARTSRDKSDSYLKTQRVRIWVYLLSGVLLLSGAAIWLFFGSVNRTITGYAQVSGGYYADCIVPASRIDEAALGQTVWIGNSSGPIVSIKPYYVTYDEMEDLYGYSIDKLYLDKDDAYYFVQADIRDEKTGYNRYTIIVDTMTPFAYYFGGGAK